MKAREVEGLDPHGALRANAACILRTRLDEVRTLADQALAADATAAQHDMRIAAKRLRYVLELFAACFGVEAEAARRAAKALQSTLGDLHDCDLAMSRDKGIPSLRAALAERRQGLFRAFAECWRKEAGRDLVALARAL